LPIRKVGRITRAALSFIPKTATPSYPPVKTLANVLARICTRLLIFFGLVSPNAIPGGMNWEDVFLWRMLGSLIPNLDLVATRVCDIGIKGIRG
jgi:hypothetical protein